MDIHSKSGEPLDVTKESFEEQSIVVQDSATKKVEKRIVQKPVSQVINQEIYSTDYKTLRSLLKNDFVMTHDDKDFRLSHEQLIKVCRIFLNMI